MHPLRVAILEGRDLFAVVRELEEVRGLRMPRELRVPQLVAPRAERRGRIDTDEKVGTATPPVGEERALIDDIGSGGHRCPRCLRRGGPIEIDDRPGDLDDARAQVAKSRQPGELVGFSFGSEQLGLRAPALLDYAPVRGLQVEPGQILALEEVIQIGRR